MDNNAKKLYVCLVGTENGGKTTLHNLLTNTAKNTSNWTGTTTRSFEATATKNSMIVFKDMPGIDCIHESDRNSMKTKVGNHLAVVVKMIVLTGTQIQRGMFLTLEVLEQEKPSVVVVNMIDLLKPAGIKIDYHSLRQILGAPVVPISARNKVGIDRLIETLNSKIEPPKHVHKFSDVVERRLSAIREVLNTNDKKYDKFTLIKVLEGNVDVISSLNLNLDVLRKIDKIRGTDINFEERINEERHKICEEIARKVVTRVGKNNYVRITRKIDNVLTGKYTAFPMFFLIMFVIFYISFGPVGSICQDFTKNMISRGIEYPVNFLINQLHFNEIFSSFTMAIVGGLSDVISFLPQILLLLGSIGFLEDTGYMARAAFIMDKLMRKIGLSGKAFVPLLMGFGCSVPAILSARILRTEQERKLTIYLIPFMSCGAKIPVYLMFLNAFFPKVKFIMMFLIYLLGILVSVLFSFVFRKVNKIEENPMILEMPNYKMPSLRNSCLRLWEHCKDFLERVGVIILGSSVVVWFMQSFDFSFSFIEDNSKSILASLGRFIAPIFTWSGFGNWKSAVALITGLLSKETIISTMSIIYRTENLTLNDALLLNFTKSSALSMIVFILLYPPCISAFATFKKEAGLSSACISFAVNSLIALAFSILTFGVFHFIFGM